MSTVSANTTALPSRRNLIAQAGMLASITAVGASIALPVLAEATGPIEAMYPEFERLTKAYAAALDATIAADWRYVEPDRPVWSPWTAEGGYKLEALPDNKCRCYLDDGEKNVAALQATIAGPFVFDPTFAITEAAHQGRVDRAKKTLSEIEAWQAEVRRRKDVAGLTAAEDAEDKANDALAEHRAAILDLNASTFRELAFQSAVLNDAWRREDAEYVIERLTELAGVFPYGRG